MADPDRKKDLSAWTTATKPTTPTTPVVPKPVEPTSGIPLNVTEAFTILDSRKTMFPLDRRELTQAEQMRLFPGVDLAPKNLEQLAEFFDKGYVTPPPSDVREPFLMQFGKGLLGGAEDLTKRLAFSALPDRDKSSTFSFTSTSINKLSGLYLFFITDSTCFDVVTL